MTLNRQSICACVLAIACASAHGTMVNANMQVSFVFHDACIIQAPAGAAKPGVACAGATLYRIIAPTEQSSELDAQKLGWTVYF